jgi:acetyl esterase/lipase
MTSRRLHILNFVCRRILRRQLTKTETPTRARQDFDRLAARVFRAPPYLLALPDGFLEWVSVGKPEPTGAILYLHGGGYIAGSPASHRGLAGRLSALSGLRVAIPDYPLAPEHPAPAAFEAAVAAYETLLDRGYHARNIVLGGDSAGGGLALALLAHLTKAGDVPAGLFAFSPWTDLAFTGASVAGNASVDRLFDPSRGPELAGYVTGQGGISAKDPRLSPHYAEFRAPPPVMLHVARTEILLDDARRMAKRLRAAGGDVELREIEDAPHVLQLFDGFVPEARATLMETAGFIRRVLRLPPRPSTEN